MFQVLFFFRLFIELGHSKLFTFMFVFFFQNKQIDWKYFCKEFCKKSWKKIILGTSDAWSTIHLSHRPSDRAWIYLRLTNFKATFSKKTGQKKFFFGQPEKMRNRPNNWSTKRLTKTTWTGLETEQIFFGRPKKGRNRLDNWSTKRLTKTTWTGLLHAEEFALFQDARLS